ncbi:MAG: response regulator [Leptolyngbyaceae cyanobacterium bins.349]|nr:response regulator [Leptolyngbyaceae cyanobacterium bins.349]
MGDRHGVSVSTKKILLIHSEPTVQEVLNVCLTHLGGWQVLNSGSPLEALRVAEQEQPDAIVFDLATAGMNFFTFLQRLRNQSTTQSIPVVLIAVEAKWLSTAALMPFQVAGVIDYSHDPARLPQQIASLLNWDRLPPMPDSEDPDARST